MVLLLAIMEGSHDLRQLIEVSLTVSRSTTGWCCRVVGGATRDCGSSRGSVDGTLR
jgi:hypothetical protein